MLEIEFDERIEFFDFSEWKLRVKTRCPVLCREDQENKTWFMHQTKQDDITKVYFVFFLEEFWNAIYNLNNPSLLQQLQEKFDYYEEPLPPADIDGTSREPNILQMLPSN